MTQATTSHAFFTKLALRDVLGLGLLVGGFVWLLARGAAQLGYHWQWYRVPALFFSLDQGHPLPGPLLKGLGVTLAIAGAAMFLALGFGLAAALLRLSRSLFGRAAARVYLETIRNTPLLVQIFFLYFVLGPALCLNRFWAAVLALSLFEGAYASEIFRSGILSIERGQWEAAYSLGLSTAQTYRRVILPQALRRVLPPLAGLAVSLVKDSALASTIAIADLAWHGQVIVSQTFLAFEVWFTVAALYLVLTLGLSFLGAQLERRFKRET